MIVTQRHALRPGERIRVLIVDDSAVIRRLVSSALGEDSAIEVVGAAANGLIALERIPQLNPDVVTLDVEMPEMDGLETLRHIRREYPLTRVIMFSTLTERGAAVTFDALQAGADDYVTKISNEGSIDRSRSRLRDELACKIRQFFSLPEGLIRPHPPIAEAPYTPAARAATLPADAVLIGVSTGGPNALSVVLPQLPSSFPLPVFVVQHMPPLFTRFLADRLNGCCNLPVSEAVDGEAVQPGNIYVAPGDFHMRVAGDRDDMHIALDQSPPLNSCRPAVDALFTSFSDIPGSTAIAAILTGMGQDGLRGARTLKAGSAFVIAQDEPSSVVWGMPGAIVNAGLADRVVPLQHIADAILTRSCTAMA